MAIDELSRNANRKNKDYRAEGEPTTTRRADNINTDNPEILMQMFIEAAKRLWFQIKQASSFIMVELGGYHAFDRTAQWCVRNPYLSICLLAAALVILLPTLIIVGFVISTIAMTFTGFLVLEGTLLTIVSMLLFGCLGALAVVLIFFAIFVMAMYFGFAHIYDLYGGVDRHKRTLKKFLTNERSRKNRGSPHQPIDDTSNDEHENIQNL